MTTLRITTCPACGSDNIRRVRRNWRGEFCRQVYAVPALEFFECPACGERIYDRDAMRRLEERSPAFSQAPVAKSAPSGSD
jgi:YgiT-type zinc finger domain-containing protein